MFQSITLGQTYSAKEYSKIENDLRIKLFNLQQECAKYNIPVLITVGGVDCSGRGDIINLLSKWLDSKRLHIHTFWRQTDEENERPDSWKYWTRLPKRGEFALFYGGWYGNPIRLYSAETMNKSEFTTIMDRHSERERALSDDGYVLVKFWLHLEKKEHAKRRKDRLKEKGALHFNPYEEEGEKNYDKLTDAVSNAIQITDKDYSPWYVVDAYDKEFKNVTVVSYLIEVLENAIKKKLIEKKANIKFTEEVNPAYVPLLDRVDMNMNLDKADYLNEFNEVRKEIFKLTYQAYKKGISSTLVFEGMDAAGKGGAIRRLAETIDARITQVIPISSPTEEDLAHHYLWRFWKHVPLCGHVTIYDRSWYGRVLVERVEGYTEAEKWKKAYSEINNFEEQLVVNNNILLKFWLHVSPEEQLKRFKEREDLEWKNYKITDDDWRNREKSPQYILAADEMFMRTDMPHAPWHIIPGNSKYFARIQVMKIYRNALRKALGKTKGDDDNYILQLKSAKEIKKALKSETI